MIVLGIESTAHTFGIAVLDGKKVLSNIIDSFSSASGGMIPGEVAQHHMQVFDAVLKKALATANIRLQDIDLVAFSQGPGLGNTLRIGATVARSISLIHKKPLIGVNHCIAHLEIGSLLTPCKEPVLLYASGANTQVIAYDRGKYRVFGETLDMGIGNFLDSFGRRLGVGFPAGPQIEEHARKGTTYIKLPYAVKGMDVSFSGMYTLLRTMIEKEKKEKGTLSADFIADLCSAVQETSFAMLVEVSERALAHCGKKELLLGGGVACNKRLQEMCSIMCTERKAKSYSLPNQYNVDNAAMIAWTGYLMHKAGVRMKIKESAIRPYERTDDVNVRWR
ncbi:MAG: bifunctional N(6)-L-threonylcarbamoyladenine synthase/serine/threonine protein kinase [Nanoarchaeota archaeon]